MCVGAAQAVIAAMKKQGVKRLIWLSAGGVGDSAPQIIRASFVLVRIILPLFLRNGNSLTPTTRGPRSSSAPACLDFTVVRLAGAAGARRDGPTNGKGGGRTHWRRDAGEPQAVARSVRWPPSWLRSWPQREVLRRPDAPVARVVAKRSPPGEFEPGARDEPK